LDRAKRAAPPAEVAHRSAAPDREEALGHSMAAARRRSGGRAMIAAVAAAGFLSAFTGGQLMEVSELGPVRLAAMVAETAGAALPAIGRAAVAGAEPSLTMRVSAETAQGRVDGLVAAIGAAGFAVDVARVPFRIEATRIGYFHPDDRAAAEALRAALASGGPNAAAELRDYRGVLPAAAPGSLELWIKG
jgi:hypothetical protein